MKDAIILAAGEGTRLRPLTSTRPKPMLFVAGRPILEWNLEALSKSGFKRAYIIVGYKQEVITNYFSNKYNGINIKYITQKEQLGTAHAISMAKDSVNGDFLVMNGDIIVSKDTISSFLDFYRKSKTGNNMCLAEVENPAEFGVAELRGDIVVNIAEKPKEPKTNLANAGVYIFNDKIFSMIERIDKSSRFEYEITDAIRDLIKEKDISGYKIKDCWIDIGKPWDLLDANEIMLKKNKLKIDKKAKIEKYVVIKGNVHIGSNTVVRSGSYIDGPCYIGNDCIIGPNCFIRPHTTIGDDCHIGNAVEIKNSIIMSHTNVPHLSYIGDSILGENCNLGAGTNVANLKFDNSEVKVEIRKTLEGSGRRKFGCIIGDNVKTGINVSIMPGRAIYPNAVVEAGSVVRNTIYTE